MQEKVSLKSHVTDTISSRNDRGLRWKRAAMEIFLACISGLFLHGVQLLMHISDFSSLFEQQNALPESLINALVYVNVIIIKK